jgi:hypothetical protein
MSHRFPLRFLISNKTEALIQDAFRSYGATTFSYLFFKSMTSDYLARDGACNTNYISNRINNLCEVHGVPEQWGALIASTIIDQDMDQVHVAFSADGPGLLERWRVKAVGRNKWYAYQNLKGATITISADFPVIAISE